MKKVWALASLVTGMSMGIAGTLQAGVCSSDGLKNAFLERGDKSFSELTALRGEFKSKFDSVSDRDEKIECARYIGRLDILRGGLLPEFENLNISVDDQKAAMDDCLAISGEIEETNSPEYHYFYTACLGFRGKLEGLMGRIKYGLMARSARGPALEVAQNGGSFEGAGPLAERAIGPALEVAQNGGSFEGAGIYRVMSALAGNRMAKPLGLYDSESALQYANFALATPEQPLPPFAGLYSGDSFYENHYYLGQSKIAAGVDQNNKALAEEGNALLASKIEEIDLFNEIGELGERKIESLAYQQLMIKLKAKADNCFAGSDWNQCLIDSLSL